MRNHDHHPTLPLNVPLRCLYTSLYDRHFDSIFFKYSENIRSPAFLFLDFRFFGTPRWCHCAGRVLITSILPLCLLLCLLDAYQLKSVQFNFLMRWPDVRAGSLLWVESNHHLSYMLGLCAGWTLTIIWRTCCGRVRTIICHTCSGYDLTMIYVWPLSLIQPPTSSSLFLNAFHGDK